MALMLFYRIWCTCALHITPIKLSPTIWLRGWDSNSHKRGYEPRGLPVPYPAILLQLSSPAIIQLPVYLSPFLNAMPPAKLWISTITRPANKKTTPAGACPCWSWASLPCPPRCTHIRYILIRSIRSATRNSRSQTSPTELTIKRHLRPSCLLLLQSQMPTSDHDQSDTAHLDQTP